jgi:hypothetical protein
MSNQQRLFSVTHWLLKAATVISLLVIGLLCLVFGAMVLAMAGQFKIPVPAEHLHGVAIGQVLAIVAAAVLAGALIVALVALVFLMAARIVETAQSGDPFVIANARRLEQIGWLLLAAEVIGLVAGMVLPAMVPPQLNGKMEFGFGLSPIGLLSILMIFVLAQIFRHGSEMRAELEGTV